MAISPTDKLKNNKDLTQHFLYTYSNANKVGPQEKVRRMFNEDLVFDRSRKSIFTQSQEFGYISDTVYTLSVGNEGNNGNSFITLRTYEGNVEFYNYTPLSITNVEWGSISAEQDIDGTYLYNSSFDPNYIKISYLGSASPDTCYVYFNSEKLTFSDVLSISGTIYLNNPKFSTKMLRGKNTVTVKLSGTYVSYYNDIQELQHNVIPGFELEEQYSEDSLSKSFYAYNPINIVQTNSSYWAVYDNPSLLKITDTVDRRLSDDYYESFHNDHHICENTKDKTLSLAVPRRLEDRNKIYGFIGGTSTEFYKRHSVSYCGENYNFYIGTGNNWNGLDLWFQKN